MKKALHWLTGNIVGLSILFLLAFIPLYPKVPLINVVRTFVYIRLEDFFVAFAIGIYILQRIRERKIPKTPLTWPIFVYWGVGITSTIFSILFIGPKLLGYFPHLVILHFLRRIEYMMLFFMAFDVVARKKSFVTAIVWTLAGTTLAIMIYGLGQKLFGWPAFLTMNEEFAKGIPLRLPATARIPSTFAGHYDLAAFVVLTIPILAAFVFAAKHIWQKIVFFLLSIGSLVMLFLTQSRTSFLVYLVGISTMLLWYKKKWFIIPVILLSFFLLNFFNEASDRFYKTFRYNDVIVDLSTGKPVGTLASLEGTTAVIEKSQSPAVENLPTGSQYIGLPQTASSAGQIKTISYTSVGLSGGTGEIATVSGSFLIQKALVYDISITTRLQGEWPLAMTAFKRNILLGSGYSTLSVASDGDYVRMLGETGILGTLSFLGILLAAYVLFFKRKDKLGSPEKAFVVGVFGGLTGLMFNGILIDVFEASKVAFILWFLLGVAVAVLSTGGMTLADYFKLLKKALTSNAAYLGYLFVTTIVLFGSSVSNYFVADDFTWLKWAASSSFTDVAKYFTNAAGFFYRPIPKVLYFVLYAVFWLKPEGYHIVSLLLYGLAAYLVYLLMRATNVKRTIALIAAIVFTVLSVHHENVFWISGMSSLLSAVFLFAGVYLTIRQERHFGWRKNLLFALAMILMGLAMFSYDGMITAPIILCVAAWHSYSKKIWTTYVPLLAIPLYWILRVSAGAVPPSGDYAYKLSTLPFNIVGNSVGYFSGTFFGPRFFEFWSTAREYLRVHRATAGLAGLGIVAVLVFVLFKIKKVLPVYRTTILWFICGFVSLGAYVGLGNMSERYAFAAGGFFIAGLGSFVSTSWALAGRRIWKYAIALIACGLIIWNVSEVVRVGGDWQKASATSREMLSIMSTQFFPLRENKSFIFINTPIRYGRAWIFPTGLADPLWHVFRFNPWAYTITNVSSPEAADSMPTPLGFAPEILIFENYQLKRLVKVEK
jgi:hypothetical protein